ncbi:ATP-binding protein [Crocosphaera sp. Alani8]|uniref:ATP-binding protein n=1 Tax=Crocosphaera sp. Alani8 TaxID=3038952 RepID=UPI00313CFF9A
MSVPQHISFKVKSDLKALDEVLGHFDNMNQPWIPKKDWLQCQLALAEGFTNAVRHAHKNISDEVFVEIEIKLTSDRLEMRIWDQGPFFDLKGFLKANAKEDNRFAGHGQGLPILQKIAAQLSYERTEDERNCLLIIKNFFFP